VDAAPVFGTEVFERQRIGDLTGVESISLISDDDEHSVAAFAAATDANQLASVQAIAMDYRVTQGFPKSKLNELFLSANTARAAIRLINQSTSGKSDRSRFAPRCATSSGASVKRSLGSIDRSDLKLANPNHFCNLLPGPTVRRLMSGARASRSEFPREENQRRPIKQAQPSSQKQSRKPRNAAC